MIISTDLANIASPLAALAAGLISAVLYGRKRRWIDAALAGVAGATLAVAVADVRLPAGAAAPLAVSTEAGRISASDLYAIPAASSIVLSGDGVREAEWRDLPARPLQWKPAAADLLWLDFPRSMSVGRIFTLTVRRSSAPGQWRLQLLAENKQVLADSGLAAEPQLSVQWLPPVAETMVLQARLLDKSGKTIAQGPVPLQVKDAVPLQIQGRFDAPSFDARALNQLLSDGGAVLDWNVTLGKSITRSETARAPLVAANAMFVDAAYVEHLSSAARAALLAQAGKGVPLVVLGGNASDAGMWQRDFGLSLRQQSPTTEKEDMRQFGVLSLPPAQLNPAESVAAPWSVLARDGRKQPWLWQRGVGRGRVVWVGVADWHKYAISAPHALALWWQSAMDLIVLDGVQKTVWQMSDPLPVPGLRSEVCAQGVKAGTALAAEGYAAMALAARADKADAVCAAFWPQKAGWVKFSAEGMAEQGEEYVYAAGDWPAWQKALRRDATLQYAARSAPRAAGQRADATAAMAEPNASAGVADGGNWPGVRAAGVLFALVLLALWWREQRQIGGADDRL
ncbi:hypothetical protein GTP56_20930 [Duganella sp. FT134W]|uniref:Uncharacterized protein n=1 Tax=Duganella margarita TaxID=2692170 RepID=A0A7X4H4H8_9BURK|nr:hypothetical protein [Duganella margarita]MYM74641.1 hypothetical protein [Duganella margarita]